MRTIDGNYIPFGAYIAAAVSLLSVAAMANDGGIAYGGSPGLLHGHPSVTMTSEKIRLVVGNDNVEVNCDFVFTNKGKACNVRMGFPDQGFGAMDPDEDGANDTVMKSPPNTTFKSFKSFVDGKPVPTKLIRSNHRGQFWHTKDVHFASGQTLHIRDIYSQTIGGGITSVGDKTGTSSEVGYVLHTGSSWHGNIGRSEITVTFKTDKLKGPPSPMALKSAAKAADGPNAMSARDVKTVGSNVVVYTGPCAPTVTGNSLQFVRTNWRPTTKDDIDLTYAYIAVR